MRYYSFYDLQTGAIHPQVLFTSDPAAVSKNIPVGHGVLEDQRLHFLKHRVNLQTGAVEQLRPEQPSDDHEWIEERGEWQLSLAANIRQHQARAARLEIRHLEQNVQPRVLRALALGDPEAAGRLQRIEAQIAELRKALRA